METLTDFIFVTGIVINLLIVFTLIKSKRKQLPQNILMVFFILLLFANLDAYATLHKIQILYRMVFIVDDLSIWLIAPLLYIYVKSIFLKPGGLIKKNLLHFLPAFISLIFISIPLFIYISFKIAIADYIITVTNNFEWHLIFRDLYLLTYLLITLRLFFVFKQKMKNNYSSFSEKEFGWVKHMLYGAIIVICIDLSSSYYETFYSELSFNSGYITIITMIIFIVYLGYFGINQSKILLPDFIIANNTAKDTAKTQKHHLSNYSKQELKELQTRLEYLLNKDHNYLNENLTLSKLAQLIPTTDKKLSTLLNQYMHTTFYDIINKYRVEAVKNKLKSEQSKDDRLLDIAYSCGFNSKTSFNRIFKKETGYSPSEYKKLLG